jgi:hypothetical protein
MKTSVNFGGALATALLASCFAASASGQEFPGAADEQVLTEESTYQPPAPPIEPLSLAREKAVQRGEQRMARLAAMKWYGFSNSRPTATTAPFTTMYSPAWQMPGGRPFAWYTSSRPIVIIASPMYR